MVVFLPSLKARASYNQFCDFVESFSIDDEVYVVCENNITHQFEAKKLVITGMLKRNGVIEYEVGNPDYRLPAERLFKKIEDIKVEIIYD